MENVEISAPYEALALIYDQIMEHVPYDKWIEDLEKLFRIYNIHPVKILDCACGTGALSIRLAQKGYVVTGIDISPFMLTRAHEKTIEAQVPVNYLQMDMTQMDIKAKADVLISYFDALNYLERDQSLKSFFKSACNALKPGGYMFLDMSTAYKMEYILNEQVFINTEDPISYIWENHYDTHERCLDFDIRFFVKEAGNAYRKYDESHRLWAHDMEDIKSLLPEGLIWIQTIDGDDLEEAKEKSERNIIVLRKEY